MSLLAVLTALFGALATVATAVSAVALARVNYSKAVIEGLRGDRDDQKERLDRQHAKLIELRAEVTTLRQENELLRSLKGGEAVLASLTGLLHDAERQRSAQHHDVMASLVTLSETIRDIGGDAMRAIASHNHGSAT